eukprot:3699007-Karenia_brevis.AAC.1
MRGAVQSLIESSIEEREWALACLGIKNGGLGVRDATVHAHAAFIASFLNCREVCKDIDPAFDVFDQDGWAGTSEAVSAFNTMVGSLDSVDLQASNRSQRRLSQSLDLSTRRTLTESNGNDPYFLAHMNLVAMPGAGAWLTAVPEDDTREWE